AEDGIRDLYVTGVQTCALPICPCIVCVAEVYDNPENPTPRWRSAYISSAEGSTLLESYRAAARFVDAEAIVIEKSGQIMFILGRSEERRVGKECRSGWLREGER